MLPLKVQQMSPGMTVINTGIMNGETFPSNQSMQIPRAREITGHNLLHPNREHPQHCTEEGDDPHDTFMP